MVTLKYHHLFSSIRLGNVTLRNRIIASPTGGPAIMPPQYITRETAAFWELRAKSGASVVTLGDNVVDSETGLMHPHKMRIDDSGIIPSLTNTARDITQYGAVASLELEHDSAFLPPRRSGCWSSAAVPPVLWRRAPPRSAGIMSFSARRPTASAVC